jgi:hypothetical protein
VRQELRVSKDYKGRPAFKEPRVSKVRQELRVFREIRVKLV